MNEVLRRILFLPKQASTFAVRADHLHYFIILTAFAGAFGVFAVGFYFIVRYRRRSETDATPRITARPIVEVLYIFTPLALFVVWFFMGFHDFVYAYHPPPGTLDIYVEAKQWMWKFTYPEGPASIGTLRVPVGRPVRLLLTSRDVIHSFFVPAFRLKKDAVPNRYTEMWFEVTAAGRYPILCAEYCGLSHSEMRGEVVALEPAEYEAWLAGQGGTHPQQEDAVRATAERDRRVGGALAAEGRRIATDAGCMRCHSTDGSPHIGPTFLDLYLRRERLRDGSTVVADEAYLTESMMEPEKKIVAGYRPLMPSFQGRLSGPDVAALLEFIKSLRTPGVTHTPAREPVFEPAP